MGELSQWKTEREIGFLNNVGRTKDCDCAPKDREKCLRGYLEAAKLRRCWAQIDREIVINHCEKLIKKEFGEGSGDKR